MKKYLIVAAVVILGVFLYLGFLRHPDISIEKTEEAGAAAETMLKEIVTNANGKGIILYINDSRITEAEYQPYFSDHLQLMLPIATFTDKLDCLVNAYENGTITFSQRRQSGKGLW